MLGIVTIAYLAYLAGYEWWAIATGHPTITDQVREVNARFVLMPLIAGLIIGGLAVHFLKWI